MKRNLILLSTGGLIFFFASCKKKEVEPNLKVPTVTTATVTVITNTGATTGGNVTSDGGATVTERGIYYGTGTTPTTASNKMAVGTGTGSFTGNLTALIPGVKYYIRAYATNSSGTGYGNVDSFVTTKYFVGQAIGGGIVFYVDPVANKALVAAMNDMPKGKFWPQAGNPSIGATDNTMGGGDINTNKVVTYPGCQTDAIAKRSKDTTMNGVAGWYLPNKIELETLFAQKSLPGLNFIADATTLGYWSSTMLTGTLVWFHCWCPSVPPSGATTPDISMRVHLIRKIGDW